MCSVVVQLSRLVKYAKLRTSVQRVFTTFPAKKIAETVSVRTVDFIYVGFAGVWTKKICLPPINKDFLFAGGGTESIKWSCFGLRRDQTDIGMVGFHFDIMCECESE